MSKTLDRLRAHVEKSQQTAESALQRFERVRAARVAAAAPVIQAFEDLKSELVQIRALRQIWGKDFDRRDDRVGGLLLALVGPDDGPYGLKIRAPGASLRFQVDLSVTDEPSFVCVRETEGLRPSVMSFVDQDRWLDYFFKVMAEIVELPESRTGG